MTRPQFNSVTGDQVKILQTLWTQWQRHALLEDEDPRAARLKWASECTGRLITSFSLLSKEEARSLIDRLKESMGLSLTEKPKPWRRINSRDRAQAAGTAGRKNVQSSFIQMASPDDLARIDEAIRRLGWTRDRYEAWLRSSSSPVSSKDGVSVRTVAEANKIWWALKAILRRSGRWYPDSTRRNDIRSVTGFHGLSAQRDAAEMETGL